MLRSDTQKYAMKAAFTA